MCKYFHSVFTVEKGCVWELRIVISKVALWSAWRIFTYALFFKSRVFVYKNSKCLLANTIMLNLIQHLTKFTKIPNRVRNDEIQFLAQIFTACFLKRYVNLARCSDWAFLRSVMCKYFHSVLCSKKNGSVSKLRIVI